MFKCLINFCSKCCTLRTLSRTGSVQVQSIRYEYQTGHDPHDYNHVNYQRHYHCRDLVSYVEIPIALRVFKYTQIPVTHAGTIVIFRDPSNSRSIQIYRDPSNSRSIQIYRDPSNSRSIQICRYLGNCRSIQIYRDISHPPDKLQDLELHLVSSMLVQSCFGL